MIRHALQQLEVLGLVEKNPGVKGGRRITSKGQSEMDLVATTVSTAATAAAGCHVQVARRKGRLGAGLR